MTLDENKIKQIEVRNNIFDLRVSASIRCISIVASSYALAYSTAHGNMAFILMFGGAVGGNVAFLGKDMDNIVTQKQELLKLRKEAIDLKKMLYQRENSDEIKSQDAYSSISFTRTNNHLI